MVCTLKKKSVFPGGGDLSKQLMWKFDLDYVTPKQ